MLFLYGSKRLEVGGRPRKAEGRQWKGRQWDVAEAAGVTEASIRACGRMIRRLVEHPVPGPHTP